MSEETNKTNNIKEESQENENKERESTTKNKASFIEFYKESLGIISVACKKTNISRWTYYDWMKKDASFKEKIDEIQWPLSEEVEDRLKKAIVQDNITAIIFYLKSKHPDYKPRFEAKLGGEVEIKKSADFIIGALKLTEDDFGEEKYEQTVKRITEYHKSHPGLQGG